MTQQLTPQQLSILAHHFLACAQAVGDYRYSRKPARESDKKLSDLQWTLLNFSDDLYTASASLVMNDVKNAVKMMKEITKGINENYRHIRNVQKAIDVATAVITLGAALFSQSPKAIDAALEKLANEIP